jgi:hypothetical protein
MRAAKIASWVTLGLVAIVFGLWWAYVRAPSPAAVCDHIIEMTVAEARATGMSMESEAAIIEKTRQECIAHKLDKIKLRGRIKYARYAKCVVAHRTLDEIYGC